MHKNKINWIDLVEAWHHHGRPGYTISIGKPTTTGTIRRIEEVLGALPVELVDFYLSINGVMASLDSYSYWIFKKIEDLVEYKEEHINGYFAHFNRVVGENYLPIFDWINGDSSGYVRTQAGWDPRFFMFWHERYLFEGTQNPSEFLIPSAKSLESFLRKR